MHIAQIVKRLGLLATVVALSFGTLIERAPAQDNGTLQLRDLLNLNNPRKGGPIFRMKGPKASFSLLPANAPPGSEVTLSISVKIPSDGYTYSTNPNFGNATKIVLDDIVGLTPLGEGFKPNHPPKVVYEPVFKRDLEKHLTDTTWTRKFRVDPGTQPSQISLTGRLTYWICDKSTCKEFKAPFQLALGDSSTKDHPQSTASVAADSKKSKRLSFRFESTPGQLTRKNPVGIRTRLTPEDAKQGDEVTLSITAVMKDGWHTYSTTQKSDAGGGLPTVITVSRLNGLESIGDSFTPDREPKHHEIPLGKKVIHEELYHGKVTWTRRYRVLSTDDAGAYGLAATIRYQVCDDRQCLQPKDVSFELGSPLAAGETIVAKAETSLANVDEAPQRKGLIPFIIAAFTAGFLALLTPCVFPMIPITISFFLKQSEKQHHRPVTMASVYCLGIIVTFTALGLLMSALFGATEMNLLATNAWVNLVLAAVLIFFGLNLLGLFEIRMPSSLMTWSSGKEQSGGIAGTLFMAFTFTLVSFSCTFAFAGLLLVMAANGEYFWPAVGMLAFSTAFSLPFFFLALFPSFLQKLPKSGGWMNRVKVTMGLIEIAAALKFLNITDQAWNPVPLIFNYTFVMSAWIIILLAIGVYLLGLIRMPHDSRGESLGAGRLAVALLFLGSGGYMALGMFATEKPTGDIWRQIISFAPPQFEGGDGDIGPYLKKHGLQFALDYDRAIKYAQEHKMPIFLDFTGVNCVNCRLMEEKMAEEHNKQQLEKFVLVQLYVDNVPKLKDRLLAERLLTKNRDLQKNWFKDVSLPAYAVVTSDGKILLESFKGLEQKDGQFAEFLDNGHRKWKERISQSTSRRLVRR